MITNVELFKKMMMVSKDLRRNVIRQSVGEHCENRHGHPMHRMHMQGMPGPMMPQEARQPFPPKGMPEGPRRMSREHLLAIISEFPDGVNQKQLAERARINASSTSEVVAKLEDDGYLVREIYPSDKRATILKLTEMGKVRAQEIRNEREGYLDQLFAKLTEEEKQTLSDLLDKLIEKPEDLEI
ncbi:MAG: MarR family transcriptional regulator [Erysipelotrichaceae bacterium]|nr:MarR family transcriptional regulator [Erysipelotrichaceae bacterium]